MCLYANARTIFNLKLVNLEIEAIVPLVVSLSPLHIGSWDT